MSAFMRRWLRHMQQSRGFLVRRAGAQVACVIPLLKSPWLMQPASLLVSSSLRECSGGGMSCSWSRVWRRPLVSANASVESGEARTIEQVWEEYFVDPSQWRDNRLSKMNPNAPDFEHKVTKRTLWVDGWSTPPWVKAMLSLVTQSKFPSDEVHHTGYSQKILQPHQYRHGSPEGSFGRRSPSPTGLTEATRTIPVGGGDLHMRSARTASEAIDVLKNRSQRGLALASYMYFEVLKRCLKPADLAAVKQVHEWIVESQMQQNVYVANNLLSAYIRCGRLDDACRVFDELLKKDVLSWTRMIGGYAQHGRAKNAIGVFNQMLQEGVQPDAVTYLSILKVCASPPALKWGKEIHAYVRQGGFESDVRVGTALLKMYAKCGSIKDARAAFDQLASRDLLSWNVMIAAYAASGLGDEAYRLLLQMRREGVKPDALIYSSILNASDASTADWEWVRDVHGDILQAGLESDVRVGNALVHMYAKCGRIDDARLVFGRMAERNLKTWTVMVGGFAQQGCEREAIALFLRMKAEGVDPDAITYLNILNACVRAGALEWGKEVHRHALDAGFELDLRVGTALVHMYAKSGSIDDARALFDRMKERDVVTWTVMIGGLAERGCGREAFELFLHMHDEGFTPDAVTYMSLLNPCASTGALEWVKEVHNFARAAGFASDVRVGNSLVHMYAKCDCIEEARLFFDTMKRRDVITWNTLIGAYAERGCGEEAYELLLEMKGEGFSPDAVTYMSILNSCASAGTSEWVTKIHGDILKQPGLEADVRVGNALVHMYAKCGSIDDARLVFDRMQARDFISWSVVIGAYAERGCGEEAYRLFLQMKQEGFKPDAVTYVSLLNACASAGALEWVTALHGHVLEAGLESDVRVGNALVCMYTKSGSIDDARLVFRRMEERDVITWNAMIGGLAQHGRGPEALEVFRAMNAARVLPDEYSFVAVLSACSHAGLVEEGRRLFLAMSQDYGIVPKLPHWNCMVDMLGRGGRLEEAKRVIDSMPVPPDGATWGALLGACRSYGNVELGEIAAQECFKLEPKEASTYVLLSNIYAAADKWEEISLVRAVMQERGIRKEPGRSWIEVGNRIHTFVAGDTSHPETKRIYAELSRLTDIIKAEGYLPDTRLVLQDIDKQDKELSLCSHSERLAMAYGLICTPSSRLVRVYKNLRVCSDCHRATKWISKVTGREIVVRDVNRFHHFKDGVCSCKDYW